MRYLSVCSGIEAATVAWHDLGWKAAAYSEIEKFPCEVLKHLYPNVPNVGDMTKFEEWKIGTIDLLVGGTPCQSFSVAGLRKGLDDPRGNLMLTYGAIAKRFRPKWLVWENVPGVLSSNGGRDFGTFLGMLGELGYGFAYRVLDAQYFGVAQRRRRVFVVGCLGDWRRAAAVLFERDSLCGNPAPSREARKGTASSAQSSATYGGSNSECADTVTSKWPKGSRGPSGNEGGLFVAQPIGVPEVMATLCSSTAGVSRPGNATTEHETYIPISMRESGQGYWMEDDIAGTLRAEGEDRPSRPSHVIGQPKSFAASSIGTYKEGVGTLRANGGDIGGGSENLIAQPIVGALSCNTGPNGHDAGNFACNQAVDAGHVIPQPINVQDVADPLTACFAKHHGASGGKDSLPRNHITQSMAVRRLTPVECERLQGFPDDYTRIPWRKGETPDGPRYKALGNSMAVPVMAWIGQRINLINDL